MRQQSLRYGCWGGIAGILQTVFILSACGGEGAAPPTPAAADLQRWVRELDSESYRVREAATKELIAAGVGAVDSLSDAVLSDSAEVSWRASTALTRIAAHGDEATLDRVSAALNKLSSSRPSLRKLASEMKAQQQQYRHNRAIAKIRGLGGNISGSWPEAGEMMPAVELMEVVDVGIAPAIAIVDAPDDPIVEVEIAERPAPRGIFGLLARLIVPEIPFPAPLPDDPFEAPPVPVFIPPDAIAPPAAPARLEIAELRPIHPLERAEAEIPRFEVPELPRVEAGDPPPPAPALEPAAALRVVEGDVAEAVAIEAVDVGFAGAIFLGGDFGGESEGEAYAELVLDRSFRGTDKDLAVLKDIPELYNLKINGAKLTDQALEHLAALPRLTSLELSGTEMSSAALHKLRKKRPELSILCRSSAILGINAGLEGPCVLTSVFYRSGAYDAGLKDGDEITSVDGQQVRDFSDLTIAVYPHKAGAKLSVKYKRAGKEHQTEVVLKPRNAVEKSE